MEQMRYLVCKTEILYSRHGDSKLASNCIILIEQCFLLCLMRSFSFDFNTELVEYFGVIVIIYRLSFPLKSHSACWQIPFRFLRRAFVSQLFRLSFQFLLLKWHNFKLWHKQQWHPWVLFCFKFFIQFYLVVFQYNTVNLFNRIQRLATFRQITAGFFVVTRKSCNGDFKHLWTAIELY